MKNAIDCIHYKSSFNVQTNVHKQTYLSVWRIKNIINKDSAFEKEEDETRDPF